SGRVASAQDLQPQSQSVLVVDESIAQSAQRPDRELAHVRLYRCPNAQQPAVLVSTDDIPAPRTPSPSTPPGFDQPLPRVGESFTKFTGPIQQGFVIPPDPVLAVGQTFIVACTNSELAVYNRTGGRVFTQTWPQFFGAVDPNNAIDAYSDPKVIYDRQSGQ